MTPEEKFLEFASEHSADYIQGWLDGLSGAIEVLRSLPKKAESSDSTSKNKLATLAGINKNSLIDLKKGRKKSLKFEDVVKIAKALGVSLDELAKS